MEKLMLDRMRCIFQVMLGKKPEEIKHISTDVKTQIQGLYRSIKKVEIQDGLTREGIEKMLMSNYYVGNKVHSYIVSKHSKTNPVTICFRKSSNLHKKAAL